MKFLSTALLCLVLLQITGCSAVDKYDRGALTKFEPVSQSNTHELWRYEAFVAAGAPGIYGLTENGEATRMRWLIDYLQMNNLSIVGFEIVDKKMIQTGQGWAGPAYKIFYTIKVPKGDGGAR